MYLNYLPLYKTGNFKKFFENHGTFFGVPVSMFIREQISQKGDGAIGEYILKSE